MSNIKQIIIKRKTWKVDEGIIGDVTRKETLEKFIDRVTETANSYEHDEGGKVKNISYIDEDTAILVCREDN